MVANHLNVDGIILNQQNVDAFFVNVLAHPVLLMLEAAFFHNLRQSFESVGDIRFCGSAGERKGKNGACF